MYINKHTHAFIHQFMYSFINICIHKFTHVFKNIHTFICGHMHIYLYLYTYTHICTIMHACVHSYTYTCIHEHIHTSIHTLTYRVGFLPSFLSLWWQLLMLSKSCCIRVCVLQRTPVKPNPHTKAVTSRAFGVWLGHWGLPFTDARELSSGDQGHQVWGEDSARSKSACTLMWSFPPRELWELILLFTNYLLYVVYSNANGLSQKANYRLTP